MPKPLQSLDPCELRILYWLACAKTDQDIADRTDAKLCTAKKRLQPIYIKLGVENRTAAASYGLMMLGVGETVGPA
jgi:DNA-binding NarL/FixJ family response regulator